MELIWLKTLDLSAFSAVFSKKVIANRLARFLSLLVDESQSSFQSNRASLDSIAIASDIVHLC